MRNLPIVEAVRADGQAGPARTSPKQATSACWIWRSPTHASCGRSTRISGKLPFSAADTRTLLLHRVAGAPLEQIHSGRIRLLLPSNAVVFAGTSGRIVGDSYKGKIGLAR